MSKVEKLASALSFLKDNEAISLDNDVFLVEGGLDGSDKCYGFKKEDNQLMIITRGLSSGYPITEMLSSDLKYIFKLSAIYQKIVNRNYCVIPAAEI